MYKFFLIALLLVFTLSVSAQNDLDAYLKNHHYAFDLEAGFDRATQDTLSKKLAPYNVIIQAEGGSHALGCYIMLGFAWQRFLYQKFGLRHFFQEYGHTSDILFNQYLTTGDTSYRHPRAKAYWEALYTYNTGRPVNDQLRPRGIDFEHPRDYVRAMKLLLTSNIPSKEIEPSIDLIRNADPDNYRCAYTTGLNQELKKSLREYTRQFVQYFGDKYPDFERIVLNKRDCKDVYRNRNTNMAYNFLSFAGDMKEPMYYIELGQAHTLLSRQGSTASIINRSRQFKNKVAVVNVFCYNCQIQNGKHAPTLRGKIDDDILKYFIPYCKSEFTLFDLSDNIELTEKYREYGQFLLVARDQAELP